MSRHPRGSAPRWWRGAAAALALLALLGVGFRGSVATAQDATPTATTECVSPEVPPGTPTPMEEGSPEAMPPMAEGTPDAEEAAEEEAAPAGAPADEATAAQIEAAVLNYAACYNAGQEAGDPTPSIALETDYYRLENYGTTNIYDIAANEGGGPPMMAEIVSVSNAMTYDDGRVSGDVEVILGGHWFINQTMIFAQDGDFWKLDEEVQLAPEPEGDTAVVGVTLSEITDDAGNVTYAIAPNVTTITQMPVIVFHAVSAATNVEAHELVVVMLPAGADPMGLLDGSVPFEQVVFLGGVFDLAGGDEMDLAFVNLEPGTYTLLCFFPSPDGTPHIARGMFTQVEVVAPAA